MIHRSTRTATTTTATTTPKKKHMKWNVNMNKHENTNIDVAIWLLLRWILLEWIWILRLLFVCVHILECHNWTQHMVSKCCFFFFFDNSREYVYFTKLISKASQKSRRRRRRKKSRQMYLPKQKNMIHSVTFASTSLFFIHRRGNIYFCVVNPIFLRLLPCDYYKRIHTYKVNKPYTVAVNK